VSRVANTYWVDERIRSQRALPRTGASLPSMRQISLDIVGTPADVRRRGGLIPSWVVFGMVLLASLAVCVTVNMRTRAKVQLASEQFTSIRSDVDTLRALNQTLRSEVEELRTNPRAIESAARNRLNMVRSNEIVVPVDE
jgi:cell division protein FtsB